MQEIPDKNLKKRVQKELAPVKIIDLTSEEIEDFDDDPTLHIRVVYESENNRLDPDKVADLIGHLRRVIDEKTNGAERFPILTFMIQEEAEIATG